jgi:hypothetical protein
MEKTLQFYCSYFHFPPFIDYVQVYMTANEFGVGYLIEGAYGTRTGDANPIGYSNILNFSIFVCLPMDSGSGTEKHELMHLIR